MADTPTLPLTNLKQERVSRGQVIGLMEDDLELDNLTTEIKSIFPKQGSIIFNSIGSLTQDTAESFLDLGKQVFGVGESKPDILGQASEVAQSAWENHAITQAENVAQQAEQAQALKDAQEIKFRLDYIQELDRALLQEDRIKMMNESLRITGGAITDEHVKLSGLSSSLSKEHILNIATFHQIAGKQEELQDAAQKQDQDTPIQSSAQEEPAAQEVAWEGRHGKVGSGVSANLGSIGGAQ